MTILLIVLLLAPSPARASILDDLLPWFSGSIATQGLHIHLNGSLSADTIQLKDAQGVYATFHKVRISWSPLALIHRDIKVNDLTIADGDLARLPASSGKSGSSFKNLDLGHMEIGRFTVEQPVARTRATLHVTASGSMHAEGIQGELAAERLDAPGTYHLSGHKTGEAVTLDLAASEAVHGLIANVADLPDIGPIAMNGTVNGPESALSTKFDLTAGELKANADGTIDLTGKTIAGLRVTANAPAMSPRPDLSWSSITVTADVKGPFATPDVSADARIAGLKSPDGGARLIALNVAGNKGDLKVTGQVEGAVVPGKQPDVLASAPIRLAAEARLEEPGEPVTFSVAHPLIEADGSGQIATEQVRVTLRLPDLAPLAAVEGEDVQGHAMLTADAGRQNGISSLALKGTVGITGGKAPVPALIGENGSIDLAAQMQGSTVTLSRLAVNGHDLMLQANGTIAQAATDLTFAASLPDVSPVEPRLSGGLKAQGRISGPSTALALDTTMTGELAAEGRSSGPFTAHLVAQNIPSAPSGQLTAEGSLLSAPINVALSGGRSADGTYHLTITRADWKSLSAGGAMTLPAGAKLPQGDLTLSIGNLGDFSPLMGKPLSGSARAALNAGAQLWKLDAHADKVDVPGTAAVGGATLALALDHPDNDPLVNGDLVVTGLKASKVSGSAHMTAKGPVSALDLTADANFPNLDGAPAKLRTAGVVDVPAKGLTLKALNAAWKGQDARLLAPVGFSFANGVDINDLRLGLNRAVLRVNGHVGSTLDLTASAQNVPANLATVASPSLDLAGTLNANARITGTSSAPTGNVRAEVSGLRILNGKEAALPAASATADVDLLGDAARLNVAARAGGSHLTVNGRTGLSMAAPVDLHADGLIEAATMDAMLPHGQRATGNVTLAAAITGTAAKPDGTVRLNARQIRIQGGNIAGLPPVNLAATATLAAGTARIDSRLNVGDTRLVVAGTAGLAHDAPFDLRAAGTVDLAVANPILLANGEAAYGRLAINTRITGTSAAPRITGGATLAGGDVRDYAEGVHLSDITARLAADGETLRLVSLTARAGNGTMAAQGTIGMLAAGMPVDIVVTARNASPISSDILNATLGMNVRLAGQLENAVTLGGRVFISQAVIQVPEKLPKSVVSIPVRVAGAPPPKPEASKKLLASFGMDLTVVAPQQIFIRGRGLNAELGGTIHIAGTTAKMQPSGGFKLIRGTFNLVGSTLSFTSGDIDFNGAAITDPALNLVATSNTANATATLTVGGTARDPKITLSSQPPLPQDQILAQLLFHTDSGRLSPFQLASIAAGLAEISGQGGGLTSPLSGLQNALGLDQLGITSGPNGQPTLQAGRYISRRVFVGAQQATGGAGARATVQVDLTKNLKLNATAGSGQTTSTIGSTGESTGETVGITYQFQY